MIVKEYIDRALAARSDNRPDFQNMIQDSHQHLFEAVIVWKLDRFARDRYDSAFYKHTLKKNSVRVVSATENIGTGAESIILESVIEGYAEYYSVELAEKTSRGMTENALKGKLNGGTVCLVRVFANTDCRETPKDMIKELIDQNTKYPFSENGLENLSDSTEIDSKNVQETPKPNYNIDSLNRFGSAEGGT